MNSALFLNEFEKIQGLDTRQRLIADNIIAQMMQEVQQKVQQPEIQHYASYITNYITKQPEGIPFLIAQTIYKQCKASLLNNILQLIIPLFTIEYYQIKQSKKMTPEEIIKKQQDGYYLLLVIQNTIQMNIEAQNLQLNEQQIKHLVSIFLIAPVQQKSLQNNYTKQIIQTINDIVYLIIAQELQYKQSQNQQTIMKYSNMFLREINILLNTQSSQIQQIILSNISETQPLIPYLLYNSSQRYCEDGTEAFVFYTNILIRFQLLHVAPVALSQIFNQILQNYQLFSFKVLYGLLKAVISNPLAIQFDVISKLAQLIIIIAVYESDKLDKYSFSEQGGHQATLNKVINTDYTGIFQLSQLVINAAENVLVIGASSGEVGKHLQDFINCIFSNVDLMSFSSNEYNDVFVQSMKSLFTKHTHTENLSVVFKGIFSQFNRLDRNISIFQPMSDILVATFNYHKQNNLKICQVIEGCLKQLTFNETIILFNVNLQNNLYFVKLISRNCRNSSIQIFMREIVNQFIKSVMDTSADEAVKEVFIQQLFEIIYCCGRGVCFNEYTQQNSQMMIEAHRQLIQTYITKDQQLLSGFSTKVLTYFLMLFKNFQSTKIKEPSNDQVKKQQWVNFIQHVNYLIYIQQYVAAQLLPTIVSILISDQNYAEKSQLIQHSSLLLNIIKEISYILNTKPINHEQFLTSATNQQNYSQFQDIVLKPNINYNPTQLLTNYGTKIIQHVATFQNQQKEYQQIILEVLINILSIYDGSQQQKYKTLVVDDNFMIFGAQTDQVMTNIIQSLLSNEIYKDIKNKSYNLLAQYASINYDQATQIFEQLQRQDNNIKNKFLFLTQLSYHSIQQFIDILPEIRGNYNNINSTVRNYCFQILRRFSLFLLKQKPQVFQNYLNEILQQINNSLSRLDDVQQQEIYKALILEITVVLFDFGNYMADYLTKDMITELIMSKQKLPQLPQQFVDIFGMIMNTLPMIIEDQLPVLKFTINYIEIFCCNADSVILTQMLEDFQEVFQTIFNKITKQLNHYRISMKRIFTAIGLACGRDFITEYLNVLEENNYNRLLDEEEIAKMQFDERQKVLSNITTGQRNLCSRVIKIVRKLQPDNSFGRYEAGQYLLVHRTVPKQLLSQLSYKSKDDDREELELAEVVREKTKQQQVEDMEEIDKLIALDEGGEDSAQNMDEDELILNNIKMTREQQNQEVYGNIITEINKIKQRYKHQIDPRFNRTGAATLNRRGGDVGDAPEAVMPLISTKQQHKLQDINRQKYQEAMNIAFGKQKRDAQKHISFKDKFASRKIQGGRQKVQAMKRKAIQNAQQKQ